MSGPEFNPRDDEQIEQEGYERFLRHRELEAKALAEFTEYFVANYPGPDTIITDPKWHAPKIFKAAKYALRELLEFKESASTTRAK